MTSDESGEKLQATCRFRNNGSSAGSPRVLEPVWFDLRQKINEKEQNYPGRSGRHDVNPLGCLRGKTAANQKLNWMEEAELSTIDVSKIMDDVSFNQVNQVMEGLYTLGNNAKLKNALATKATVSKDGKTWTFKIRKNAKWSMARP